MVDNFSMSQDIICPEEFNEVVQELGSEGDELLAAVQKDETVFYLGLSQLTFDLYKTYGMCRWNDYDVSREKRIVWNLYVGSESEPPEYNEDQKDVMAWTGGQPYAPFDQSTIIFDAPRPVLPQIPANVDYAGDLDFNILISSQTASRNSWIYSAQLQKVFINMQNVLPVDVKRAPTDIQLYLRATMLFSLPQYAQEFVQRCSAHLLNNKRAADADVKIATHVLRCSDPNSMYMGNTERNEHLSVLTPLGDPQAGTDTVRINYQFMCKNSCPSGMNRRAVDVIFTLEDRLGNVLGRRKLAVRVCSCPKRDKEKEEKEHKGSNQPEPSFGRKKRCTAMSRSATPGSNSTTAKHDIVYVPPYRIFDRQTAERVLKMTVDSAFSSMHASSLDEAGKLQAKECWEEVCNVYRNLFPSE